MACVVRHAQQQRSERCTAQKVEVCSAVSVEVQPYCARTSYISAVGRPQSRTRNVTRLRALCSGDGVHANQRPLADHIQILMLRRSVLCALAAAREPWPCRLDGKGAGGRAHAASSRRRVLGSCGSASSWAPGLGCHTQTRRSCMMNSHHNDIMHNVVTYCVSSLAYAHDRPQATF